MYATTPALRLAPTRTAGRLLTALALALACWLWFANDAEAAFEDFDFESVAATVSTNQAGGHPDFFNGFRIAGDPTVTDGLGQAYPWASMRNFDTQMPPGMTGNPAAFPTCDVAVFYGALRAFTDPTAPQCQTDSQVGVLSPGMYNFLPPGFIKEPVYNLASPGGDVVARLGFWAVNFPVLVDVIADPERDWALTTRTIAPAPVALTGTDVTIWGVPTAPSHDAERFNPFEAIACNGPCGGPTATGMAQTAFFTNPTSCGPAATGFDADSYVGVVAGHREVDLGAVAGCESVPFDPTIDLQPTSSRADSPSGMDVELAIPQDGLADPDGLASAHLKRAVVTLPDGVALNPAAANGLQGCSMAEIGLTGTSPIRFDDSDPSCSNGSKVGTVKITTPVLPDPLEGSLYLADQGDNPFDSLLAGYMVAKAKGIQIKLAGRFDLDPDTGQVTATFDNNPQQPFSKLELHFKGGNRGVIVTPPSCGTYEIRSELSPWSAADPENPTADEVVTSTTSFTIDKAPDGGACLASSEAERPFNPDMSAGVQNPSASTYSPFNLRLTRPDGHQELSSLNLQMPQGVTAKLAGVAQCPDATLNAISKAEGTGAAENTSPSCPANSKIGAATVGAGAGSTPYYVQTGKAYLAGPYKGAPLSLAVVVPALAGPFDLGSEVVRSSLNVDPRTAQITVQTDPLPQILHGIPLKIRDLRVNVDREQFMLSPTNCDPMQVQATVQGSHGATAALTNRFQVGDCGSLGFAPKLKLDFGKSKKNTKRNQHPPLRANLSFNEGDANISSVQVALPEGVLLDQERIGKVCSREAYAAESCPAASQVGYAKATTPLLDQSVEGPVYLKASDNVLPDLAADLNGQIDIDLFGRIDQREGKRVARIQNTFDVVPDVPVSSFELTLAGGKDGLLVNSKNICRNKRSQRVSIDMTAHNEMRLSENPLIGSACKQINKKKAKRLNKKAKKLQRKAKKANSKRKAKKLRKQARKLKRQARKLGR